MNDIIVSAHGGRWSDTAKSLIVPPGSAVAFYVHDGRALSNKEGFEILDELRRGVVDRSKIVETAEAGGLTYDYECWYAPEFAAHCGLFEVGSKALVASLQPYKEDNPLPLSQIFQWFPNRTIYWLACRTVTPRGTSSVLHNPPDAFLGPASRSHND